VLQVFHLLLLLFAVVFAAEAAATLFLSHYDPVIRGIVTGCSLVIAGAMVMASRLSPNAQVNVALSVTSALVTTMAVESGLHALGCGRLSAILSERPTRN
jgi:hypothetical protein